MKWNLEELTEDCVARYLESKVAGQVKIFSAWNFNEPKYPCAVVLAENTEPVVESADWHDARKIAVRVAVMTDAAPEVDAAAVQVTATRDRHINAKTLVLDALCVSGLLALLNAQATEGIGFSMAQVTNTERSVDGETRKLVTTINLEVIAEPVTGS